MAIRYAGGTIINATEVAANVSTKNALSDFIKTKLVLAGWTNVSGSSGSWVMTSAATGSGVTGLQMRVTMSNSATNCLSLKCSKFDGTQLMTIGLLLLPNQDFRIIANKHQFFVFVQGTTVARGFAAAGVPYVDATARGSSPTSCIWGHCNTKDDTDTTIRDSFRNKLHTTSFGAATVVGTMYSQENTTYSEISSLTSVYGAIRLSAATAANDANDASGLRQWHGSSYYLVHEPILGWGDNMANDAAKLRGQLWDSVIITKAFPVDSTITLDGRTYFAITDNNSGSGLSAKGTLFVAVT